MSCNLGGLHSSKEGANAHPCQHAAPVSGAVTACGSGHVGPFWEVVRPARPEACAHHNKERSTAHRCMRRCASLILGFPLRLGAHRSRDASGSVPSPRPLPDQLSTPDAPPAHIIPGVHVAARLIAAGEMLAGRVAEQAVQMPCPQDCAGSCRSRV